MAEIHPFYETYRGGCGNGAMVEPLRHRQTKGAATDMFYLTPPRHISTNLGILATRRSLPVFPDKQTISAPVGTSHLCHYHKSGPYLGYANWDSFGATRGHAMKLLRRKFLKRAGAVAAVPAFPQLASALDYPTRPVRIIAGFAAGGGVDITARLIC